MPEELPDVRPGQQWRFPNGDEVIVNAVDGEQIDGTITQKGTLAVWIKSRSDLQGAVLVAPVPQSEPQSDI
jgi:hypothetical protein